MGLVPFFEGTLCWWGLKGSQQENSRFGGPMPQTKSKTRVVLRQRATARRKHRAVFFNQASLRMAGFPVGFPFNRCIHSKRGNRIEAAPVGFPFKPFEEGKLCETAQK